MANYARDLFDRLNKTGIHSPAAQEAMMRKLLESQIEEQREINRFRPKKVAFFVNLALREMFPQPVASNQEMVLRQLIEASQRKAQVATSRDPETVPKTMSVLKTRSVGKSELKPKIVGEDPDETE